jgi:putative colanic acid biosynthesis acetyltransferase WcaF
MTKIRNDLFDARKGLDRGRPKWVEAIWYLLKCVIFLSPLPFPSSLKRRILRWFGARIGEGVVIKPRVNIHFPWKLTVGDHSWIGEEAFILNFEPVTIGAHCCISQRVFLCGGNHDYRLPDMPYRNRPITIEDGVWIGAQSFVGPDVTIGMEAVIIAGSVVTRNQPVQMVCTGNPCVAVKTRWQELPARTLTDKQQWVFKTGEGWELDPQPAETRSPEKAPLAFSPIESEVLLPGPFEHQPV